MEEAARLYFVLIRYGVNHARKAFFMFMLFLMRFVGREVCMKKKMPAHFFSRLAPVSSDDAEGALALGSPSVRRFC